MIEFDMYGGISPFLKNCWGGVKQQSLTHFKGHFFTIAIAK
jgi:hypothetical protein